MKQFIRLIAIIMALFAPQILKGQPQSEVDYASGKTRFAVETNADAQQVKLRIYKEGIGAKPVKTIKMSLDKGTPTHWEATVKGDWKGYFYTFDVKYGGKFNGECPGI